MAIAVSFNTNRGMFDVTMLMRVLIVKVWLLQSLLPLTEI